MKRAFPKPLIVEAMDDSLRHWRLVDDFEYEFYDRRWSIYITVPIAKGFVSDGASIPKPLLWLLPAWGRYSRAAIIHDFLCLEIKKRKWPYHWSEAAWVFFTAMRDSNVNPVLARLMYWAVLADGYFSRGKTQ